MLTLNQEEKNELKEAIKLAKKNECGPVFIKSMF